jgi:hypothetical protein
MQQGHPEQPVYRAHLASAYALKGETEQAAAELAEAQKLTADDRYSSIARLLAVQYVGVPKIRDLFENTFWLACGGADCRKSEALVSAVS